MSFFVPGRNRIPGSNNIQTITVTENANIKNISVDKFSASVITDGIATLQGGYLTGLSDPIVPSGAATKNYVDNVVSNITWKKPCRLATILLDNLSLSGLPIVDGIQTVVGDRILVKNQTDAVDNGYYITSMGSWIRTDDMEVGQVVAGYTTVILEGVSNADTSWLCSNNQYYDIVGTNMLYFVKFTGFNLAGAGLSQTGDLLNVNTDSVTIHINGSNNLALTNTTVIPGNYGSASKIPVYSVNASGQITNSADVNIQEASGSQGGIVNIINQSFTGIKTFQDIHTPLLSGLQTPIDNTDAANKAYVDSVASGINWTLSVRVLSSIPINLIVGGFLTIDSVSLVNNDRVLVAGGSSANPNISGSSIDNGIYLVQSGSWIRSTDMPPGLNVSGYASFVTEGTDYANTGFVCSTSSPNDIVDTDALQWVQFAGFSESQAGAGLTKTGNVFSVNVDDIGIEISGNNLQLKDDGVTSAKLAVSGVTPGSYGSSTEIPTFTVDSKGIITVASNMTLAAGDVNGPISSTNNAFARFDGVDGKLIKNSAVTSDDFGNVVCRTLTSNVPNGTAPFIVSSTTPVLNLTSSNVVTNADLSGPVTSIGNVTSVSQTGTGSIFVMDTSPTISNPIITGSIANAIGTLSSPSYSFSGDSNTGMYSSAPDTIDFSIGGSNKLSISSIDTTINIPLNITDATFGDNTGGSIFTSGGIFASKNIRIGAASTTALSTPSSKDGVAFSVSNGICTITNSVGPLATLNTCFYAAVTFTDANPIVATTCNTICIGGAPVSSGSLTITNAYALNVLSGNINLGPGIISSTGRITMGSGSPSLPSYSFTTDPTTGMYNSASNVIDFATSGVNRVSISNSSITSSIPFREIIGTASIPSYSFGTDTNTGIYSSGADTLDFTTGGTNRLSISSNSVTSTLPITSPSYIYSGKPSYTQLTSSTTSVPVTTSAGFITTFTLLTAPGLTNIFAITSSLINSNSLISLNIDTYTGTPVTDGIPVLSVNSYGSNTADITVTNYGANSLNGTIKFSFLIL